MLKCSKKIMGTKKGIKLEIINLQNYLMLKNCNKLDAEKIEKTFRPPETVGFWRLNDYINNLESSGLRLKKHIIYKNYLFSFPLILISMVLLGCALSIKRERIKKNVIKILYGLIIGLIFHFSSDLIKTLGQSSDLNIFLSVWAAPLIFNFLLLSSLYISKMDKIFLFFFNFKLSVNQMKRLKSTLINLLTIKKIQESMLQVMLR